MDAILGSFGFLTGLAPIVIVILIISIRQVNEYQRGVMFTLGKYTGMKNPGWRIVWPIIQKMVRVDLRTKVVDVPDQEAITKDNISVRINAVIYYKVSDAAKSIIEVENFYFAVSQLAQTTMRNAVGEVDLDELLRNRDDIAAKIKLIVDKASDPWGILVETVELKDIGLPDDMKRTMAKAAEAEREKKAVIINSEGEVAAAENMRHAAETLAKAPGALHLRTLQAINDLSSDQSNTTIWMVPIEALRALEGIAEHMGKK
ncbi:slipin family protein [Patescibacteria group bacterium]|nr:slipin family protein [Patescibacteria group bacterium]MBU1016278.1 slipin family protein [Patescibacteria group bacterium]MBU1685524.1 slipin family protein [Patescibacteria group bacterium]MBU1767815.1 slipin family protein [Candidatus Omnitrophota bacterium]MBU1938863.1 slipin family protein [Patescibacteria group bacterium]